MATPRGVATHRLGTADLSEHTCYVLQSGELSVKEGEVFAVWDTTPEGSPGMWAARRTDGGRPLDECAAGLIPGRARAGQLAVKQHLSSGMGGTGEQRGGAFLKSFKRAKSADRSKNSRGTDEDDG